MTATLASIADALNACAVEAPRRGQWSATHAVDQVRRYHGHVPIIPTGVAIAIHLLMLPQFDQTSAALLRSL
jgi:hypothetical protein